MSTRQLSIVIPALNEAAALPLLLEDLRALWWPEIEIVVADGGSGDGTVEVARRAGIPVVSAPRGRARQLNAGARATDGEWLLFLHADSRVSAEAARAVQEAMNEREGFESAVFRFAIDLPDPWKGMIERGQAVREAVFRLPYGDQGLLVRRDAFDAVGGYPEIPIMEDVALVRLLGQRKPLRHLNATLLTSGRRYLDQGPLRTQWYHALLLFLYFTGVPPDRLAAIRANAAR